MIPSISQVLKLIFHDMNPRYPPCPLKFTLAAYQTKGAKVCDLSTARIQGILSPLVDSFRQLPPTESALYYHTLRSVYVSGHLWGQADNFAPELSAFEDWGWGPVPDLHDPNALLQPVWSIMLDVYGAYEKLSKVCNCGTKTATVEQKL